MYIGNDLQIAHPSYKIIDDISSGFNGSTTSFALQVNGAAPVPFPISTQQVMISVNGVVQEPDPSGSAGFKLLGSNIVFSSAPANGHAFFGVINAGADYVTAGSEFPDGSVTAPSFTFQDDQDTGWFRIGSGSVGYSANGVQILDFDGNGLNIPDNKKLQIGSGTDLQIYHDGSGSYIDETGTGSLIIQSNTVQINNAGGTEIQAKFIENGAVELYHNNSKSFYTTDNGAVMQGYEGVAGIFELHADEGDDNADKWRFVAEAGAAEFSIGNYSSGSWETNLKLTGNAGVHLYYDNTAVCYTDTDALRFNDSKYLKFGSSQDLQIYHDGSNSYIKDAGTGWLVLESNNLRINSTGSEPMANFTQDGAVELYHDNSKKIETTSSGVTVSGTVQVGSNSAPSLLESSTGGGGSEDIFRVGLNRTNASTSDRQIWSEYTVSSSLAKFAIYARPANDTGTAGLKFSVDAVAGTVSDSKGNLRDIPLNSKNGAYTLVASDAGKAIDQQSGGWTVNNSVFSAGDAVTLINNSGSDQTITQGSGLTIYNTADATTGNRTLAGRGMATIMFLSASNCYISGAGLS